MTPFQRSKYIMTYENSTFMRVKKWFNKRTTIVRKKYFEEFKWSQHLLDRYRLYLMDAGYLETVKPGVYRRTKRIPLELSMRTATEMGRTRSWQNSST